MDFVNLCGLINPSNIIPYEFAYTVSDFKIEMVGLEIYGDSMRVYSPTIS